VSYGVDAAVDGMQPTPGDLPVDRAVVQPAEPQLRARDDAVLVCREYRDGEVDGAFATDTGA
jgi:hypothetical protein